MALYAVLVAVAILTTTTTALVSRAIAGHRLTSLDRDDMLCEVLRADAVACAAEWLRHHGRTISTPLDAPHTPVSVIASDAFWQGIPCHVSVDIWDAASGIPCMVSDFPLTALLPTDVVPPVADNIRAETWWLFAESALRDRYPSATPDDSSSEPAISVIAAAMSNGMVNWRTAPWPVVLEVLGHHQGLALAPALRQAREQGEDYAFPDSWRPTSPPYLTASANRWCLLIVVRIGTHERRWWEVLGGADAPRTLLRHRVDQRS